jgi:exodeoxyribonuclease VIII
MLNEFMPSDPHPEIRWDVPDDEYYGTKTLVSQSMLKDFIESPLLYHGRYVTREFPPRKTTDSLFIGKALHCLVLEPQKFDEQFLVVETTDRRTKLGKENVALAEAAGKFPLSQADLENLKCMADGVFVDEQASLLLEYPRLTEAAFRWTDEESGIECKAKLDALVPDSFSYALVVDLKSTRDPRPKPFAKSCIEYGYDLQAAQYCRAAALFTGRPAVFAFIAIRSEVPYDCWAYRLSNEWTAAAERKLSETLAALKHAQDTDYWFAPGQNKLTQLDPPGWARDGLGL